MSDDVDIWELAEAMQRQIERLASRVWRLEQDIKEMQESLGVGESAP